MTRPAGTPVNFPRLAIPRRILLGPGPSMVDPRVLEAQATPLLGHLDPDFVLLMDSVKELLQYVFQTANPLTIPVSGTGSAAMEAAIANTVEPDDSVLVCVSGYFGQRLADMAHIYGAETFTIVRPWGEVFTAEEIGVALERHPAQVVAIVHAETSTGAKQPLEDVARVAHDHGALLIVDAVTSLGGVQLFVDQWDLDVTYAGSQKCLSCPPGMSPITLGPRAAAKLEERNTRVRNWYLDLSVVQRYWGKERTYHHTAPISNVYGFYEALRIVGEEGLENRWLRHRRNAELFWNGLAEIGLDCLVEPSYRLESLTTIRVPEGVDEAKLRRRLIEEHGIEIGGGLGELKGKVVRVGLMGYSSSEETVRTLLTALKQLI